MKSYSLAHLTDGVLERDLAALDGQHRTTLAELLAHLAEFDARRLYLPAAHPSMYSYCVRELHWCEQAAFKRIRAARTARRFPGIFPALADGRLHLSAIVLLTPYLTPENASELSAAVVRKSKSEIERLLAERFPRPDMPTRVQTLSAPPAPGQFLGQLSPQRVELENGLFTEQLSPGTVASPPSQLSRQHAPGQVQASEGQLAPGRIETLLLSPGTVERSAPGRIDPRPRVAPLAPQRFALQVTVSQSTHDKLHYAQALLSHQVPAEDVAQVLDRALDALIARLEKRKFAASGRPRQPRATPRGRYIPAHVKRAVWERDGGRCTFMSESGRRCPARELLEFDHRHEVARGGQASVEGIRLRCRAHNQYGAERTFGVEFMRHKRAEARNAAASRARTRAARRAPAGSIGVAAEEVIPWLRALGFRADEARRAAARCETVPDASLEQRVRLALSGFHPRTSAAFAGRGS